MTSTQQSTNPSKNVGELNIQHPTECYMISDRHHHDAVQDLSEWCPNWSNGGGPRKISPSSFSFALRSLEPTYLFSCGGLLRGARTERITVRFPGIGSICHRNPGITRMAPQNTPGDYRALPCCPLRASSNLCHPRSGHSPSVERVPRFPVVFLE